MTSTPFTVGLGEGKRSSSRVLRPPGGGHTDIFGSEPEFPRLNKHTTPSAVIEQEEPEISNNGTEEQNGNCQIISDTIELAEPEEQVPAAIEVAIPDIVEKKTEEVNEAMTASIESRKRGRVPPGGFSSRLW